MFEQVDRANRLADLTPCLALAPIYRNRSEMGWKRILFHPTTFWVCTLSLLIVAHALVAERALEMREEFVSAERQFLLEQQEAQRRIEERNQRIARLLALESSGVVQSVQVGAVIADLLTTASGEQKEFLQRILPEAIKVGAAFGIPPSAIVGMAIYESHYGTSELALQHNNFFGIKALSTKWEGNVAEDIHTRDSGVKTTADFRAYGDLRESVMGYAEFLRESSRYEKAFTKTSGVEFVRVLNLAGYCPDRDYTQRVAGIIERHSLASLDGLATSLLASK